MAFAWLLYLTDMSTEYNTRLCGSQIKKDLTSLQQPLCSVPKEAIVERFKCILKYHVHLYVALLNLQFILFCQTEENNKDLS